MADILFFSGVMDDKGEIRLIKVEKSVEVAIPVRVNPVVSRPKDVPITDPTLAAFHDPKDKGADR